MNIAKIVRNNTLAVSAGAHTIGEHSFHWNAKVTGISEERKREIVAWVNSLDAEHRKMIEELRRDAAAEAEYYTTSEN